MNELIQIGRPSEGEYLPYFGRYIDRVPEGELLGLLERQLVETRGLLESPVARERAGYRYAPDKWTVREVVGHVSDTERVMAYRALRFGRGDPTPLPGFDENLYTPAGRFEARTLEDLVAELTLVRRSTLSLFRGFPADAWARSGEASGHRVTVRALGYIIAGHELHHRELIAERYLGG